MWLGARKDVFLHKMSRRNAAATVWLTKGECGLNIITQGSALRAFSPMGASTVKSIILAAAACAASLMAAASAAVTITVAEVGNDVTIAAEGTLDLTGASLLAPALAAPGLRYLALAALVLGGLAVYGLAGQALGAFRIAEFRDAHRRR